MNEWQIWTQAHSAPPLGHLLRQVIPDRWFRVHNFAAGKRVPETQADRLQVLYRNNVLASCVLGIGAPCTAFLTHYGPGPVDTRWARAGAPPDWKLDEDAVEDLSGAEFYVTSFKWCPGHFDEVILRAASGKIGPVAVLSSATHGAYCPYEGGADAFLARREHVSAAENLFEDWLSDLESGL